jgi:predicted RNA-binding Zn-ribbon protein involved in translation (DUF1610 family)
MIEMLMINCPETNIPVPTGIAMSPAALETTNLTGNSFKCPQCGEMHTWRKKDAFHERKN